VVSFLRREGKVFFTNRTSFFFARGGGCVGLPKKKHHSIIFFGGRFLYTSPNQKESFSARGLLLEKKIFSLPPFCRGAPLGGAQKKNSPPKKTLF